jgi:hypothetical protein
VRRFGSRDDVARDSIWGSLALLVPLLIGAVWRPLHLVPLLLGLLDVPVWLDS